MGLISKTTYIKWNNKYKQWYVDRGYVFTKREEIFLVDVNDLPENSHGIVQVKCDGCNEILEMKFQVYKRYVKDDATYYCVKCKNNKQFYSFKQWCIDNNREDIVDRWDYKLNKCNPNEITYASFKYFYFKCALNIHESECYRISEITNNCNFKNKCKKCNSFGAWFIENIGITNIELFWSDKNIVNMFDIPLNHAKKIWFKCSEKNYHEDYLMRCSDFINGSRCPYCSNRHGKIHKLDSLGQLLHDKNLSHIWSDKNKNMAFNYAPVSASKVWWRCHNNEHPDYERKISNSYNRDFCCPECNNSKGEKEILSFLISNNIEYISQKYFENLVGLGGGKLLYDFYLPTHNLLIEYDGEFHYQVVYSKNDYIKQQEHDKLKNDFAIKNKITLLRIPYWEFDNIAKILNKNLLA